MIELQRYQELVSVEGDKLVTLSITVAGIHKRQHGHVLRDIRTLHAEETPPEFSLSNFGESTYTDERGKQIPCYTITTDGYTLPAMGDTGRWSHAVQAGLYRKCRIHSL
jgi:Rha family phage regulatory protein